MQSLSDHIRYLCLELTFIYSHDFNDDFGGRAFADVRPKWAEKPILGEWSRYIEAEFGTELQRYSLSITDFIV